MRGRQEKKREIKIEMKTETRRQTRDRDRKRQRYADKLVSDNEDTTIYKMINNQNKKAIDFDSLKCDDHR